MNQENSEYLALRKEAASKNTSSDRLKELAALSNDLAETVASNLVASPELLHILAFHQSRLVKKAVISNSNTSIKTLLELAIYFPKKVLNNETFIYYASKKYQKYELLRNIPSNVLYILIQQNNVPQFILTHARYRQEKHISKTAMLQNSLMGEINQGWHQLAEEMVVEHSAHKFMDDFNGVIWNYTQGIRSRGDSEKPIKSFQMLKSKRSVFLQKCKTAGYTN